MEYKVADVDSSGNIIVAGTCLDSTICPTSSSSSTTRPIFEYIEGSTLLIRWSLYMRFTSTDLSARDVMAVKFSPSGDNAIAAIKLDGSDEKVVFARIPSTQATPTVSNLFSISTDSRHMIDNDGILYDGTNLYVAYTASWDRQFTMIKATVPLTGGISQIKL